MADTAMTQETIDGGGGCGRIRAKSLSPSLGGGFGEHIFMVLAAPLSPSASGGDAPTEMFPARPKKTCLEREESAKV